jgi:hypothetical protein
MNCREFRRKHDAYVDDTLSGVDIEGMDRHLRLCQQCAALDTRIRRSLLIARNLPTIQPSAAFGERLQMRLAQERAFMAARERDTDAMLGLMTKRHRGPLTTGTFVALAAGIAVAAGVSMSVMLAGGDDRVIRLAPVAARDARDGGHHAGRHDDLACGVRGAACAAAPGKRRGGPLTT